MPPSSSHVPPAVPTKRNQLTNDSPVFTSTASISLPLYVVGPATHRALSALTKTHLPHCTIYGADSGNGENLAHFILEHYNGLYIPSLSRSVSPSAAAPVDDPTTSVPAYAAKPHLLFLVAQQHRPIIPDTLSSASLSAPRRIAVDELVLYETGLLPTFASTFRSVVAGNEQNGVETQWVVVFSPTGCKEMLQALGILRADGRCGAEEKRTGRDGVGGVDEVVGTNMSGQDGGRRSNRMKTFVATIGPTTRDFMRAEFGFEADVCAETPSPEGVGDGIRRSMEVMGLGDAGG